MDTQNSYLDLPDQLEVDGSEESVHGSFEKSDTPPQNQASRILQVPLTQDVSASGGQDGLSADHPDLQNEGAKDEKQTDNGEQRDRAAGQGVDKFDWDDFEARYEKAMRDASGAEESL